MATQAIVSAVANGEVLYKIVSGCNGSESPKLAKVLLDDCVRDGKTAFEQAKAEDLGCHDCLFVITPDVIFGDPDQIEEVPPRYRETFADPKFNPRWKQGIADYVCIVDFDAGKVRVNE